MSQNLRNKLSFKPIDLKKKSVSYAIVERHTDIIQENEDKILCIFSTRLDAVRYLKLASRPESEIYIIECEVIRAE